MRTILVLALLVTLGAWAPSASTKTADEGARVRQACLVSYVHGIDLELAERKIGTAGVPHLLRLLTEPDFPRHDNVVAFLAYLGGPKATRALVPFLDAADNTSAQRRARLLVPEALGRIAGRGDDLALEALLRLTEPEALEATSPDLVEMALYGLALTGHSDSTPVSLALATPSTEDVITPAPLGGQLLDPSEVSHDAALTVANHVATVDPIDGPTLGTVLVRATRIVGTSNYFGDTACCVSLSSPDSSSKDGPAIFGAEDDGLDKIDDQQELDRVFDDPIARVKVVNMIRWCAGGPGTNILGCARQSGDSMVVVRVEESVEPALWMHEYGHNVDLSHAANPTLIMHDEITALNVGIQPVECVAFHNPPGGTGIVLGEGSCPHDFDGFAATVDNCPEVPNEFQADNDQDGVGNVCDNCLVDPNSSQVNTDEDDLGDICDDCILDPDNDSDSDELCAEVDNCPTIPNADQLDGDNDGVGDSCDNCPVLANDQADLDADNIGDLCDTCTDTDGDGRGNPGIPLNTCADDNCPDDANPDQQDADSDGVGDVCDVCPADAEDDSDRDGFCADQDNCPMTSNPSQVDTDADRDGNACDADDDGDAVPDMIDNCSLIPNANQEDADKDGLGDLCDRCVLDPLNDVDADDLCANTDNCPAVNNADQLDTDDDGDGDACDPDDDNDGMPDDTDNCPTLPNPGQSDGDLDGAGDACDNCLGTSNSDQADQDLDGAGDLCDSCTDSDGDGLGDPDFPLNTCVEDPCPHFPKPARPGDQQCM